MWNLAKPETANKYNISLSHGMSSIVVLLSEIFLSGVLDGEDAKITRELLTGLLILSNRSVLRGLESLPPTCIPRHGYGVRMLCFTADWRGAMATLAWPLRC